MTKLTVGFRSFVKAPKNCPSPRLCLHDFDTTAATSFATSVKSLPVQHNTAQHTQRTQNSGNPEDTDLIYTKQNAVSRFTPLKKTWYGNKTIALMKRTQNTQMQKIQGVLLHD
jgi:hypothetical protein